MMGDVALRNEGVKPFGPARHALSAPEHPQTEKESQDRGCMRRSKALYDGQNMHMIEKQLRPRIGAPFGQA